MTDKEWQEKCNLYIKIHDAVVSDNEKLYAENVRLKEAVEAEREENEKIKQVLHLTGLKLTDTEIGVRLTNFAGMQLMQVGDGYDNETTYNQGLIDIQTAGDEIRKHFGVE